MPAVTQPARSTIMSMLAFHWRRRAVWLMVGLFGLQWGLLASAAAPGWDGAFYYAYARSPIFDGDLQLSNDLRLAYPEAGPEFAARGFDQNLTTTGYVDNPFAPGAALLWLPWLATLRLGGALLGFGPLTGYERLFTAGAAAFSMLAGLAAGALSYRLARQLVGNKAALWGTLTLLLTTPLLHYQFREPFYSHAAAALATTWVVLYWYDAVERRDLTPLTGFWLGVSIGLAALVRWQHLLYLALPLLSALYSGWIDSPAPDRRPFRPILVYGLGVAAGTAAMFSIQLALWRLFYGTWLALPQGQSFLDWRTPWLWPTLASTFHGLLTWMPVTLPAVLGLISLARRRPPVGWPLLVVLALELYLNGSTRDWFGGGAYGPRRFSSELAIWVVGYAALVAWLRLRWPAALLSLGLVWHQWVLLRYGLSEQLGGFVISMSPTFQWQDMTWAAFGRQLVTYAPRAFTQARDFWVLAGSPLARWLEGVFPWADLGIVVGLGAGLSGLQRGFGRIPSTHLSRRLLAGVLLAIVVALDVWILSQT